MVVRPWLCETGACFTKTWSYGHFKTILRCNLHFFTMVLRLFHKTGRKRVASIRPKLSRRLTHALGSKVTVSLDTNKSRVFAVEIPAKTALGLITSRFSLNSLEQFGYLIVMIVLFPSKYEILCGCSSKL